MKVKTVSYSFMETFMDCPLRHDMKYNKKILPMESDKTAMHFGSLVHQVLEELRMNPIPENIPKMVDEAANKMEFDIKLSVITRSKEVLKEWIDNREFGGREVMNTEWRFDKPLPSGDFNINGYIDLVEIDDEGVIRVTDYKSGRFVYTMEDTVDSLQLMMYAIAVFDEWKPSGIEVSYDMIQMGQIVYKVTKSDIINAIKRIKRIKQMIERCGKYPKPNLSFKCGWCDTRYKCPAFQKLSMTERETLTVEVDGIEARVREYHRLSGLEKAVGIRKSDLKSGIEEHLNNKPDSPVLDLGDIKARMIYGKERVYDPGVVSSLIPIEDISLIMDVGKGKLDSYMKVALKNGNITQQDVDTIMRTSETIYKRGWLKVG